MAAEATHLLPALSTLTKVFLGISAAGTTVAVLIRRHNRRETSIGGWCGDGLNIFTILVLFTIIYFGFAGDQDALDRTITENIGLIFWSLGYCAVMLLASLFESLKSEDADRD